MSQEGQSRTLEDGKRRRGRGTSAAGSAEQDRNREKHAPVPHSVDALAFPAPGDARSHASGGHPSASQKLPTRFSTLLSARTRRLSIHQAFGTSDKSSISRHTRRLSARTKRVSVSIFQRSRFTTHGGVNLQVATSRQSPFSGHTRLVSQNIFQRSVYTTQSGTRSEFATSRQSSSTRHTRRVSQNIFRPRSHTK